MIFVTTQSQFDNILLTCPSTTMIEAFQRLSLTSTQYYTQISTTQFSDRLINCPPFKKIDSILIHNFKSFSTHLTTQKEKTTQDPSLISPLLSDETGQENLTFQMHSCFASAIKETNLPSSILENSSQEKELKPIKKWLIKANTVKSKSNSYYKMIDLSQ